MGRIVFISDRMYKKCPLRDWTKDKQMLTNTDFTLITFVITHITIVTYWIK
jgi:hypothetical protein